MEVAQNSVPAAEVVGSDMLYFAGKPMGVDYRLNLETGSREHPFEIYCGKSPEELEN